jgi:hypothetical protein
MVIPAAEFLITSVNSIADARALRHRNRSTQAQILLGSRRAISAVEKFLVSAFGIGGLYASCPA